MHTSLAERLLTLVKFHSVIGDEGPLCDFIIERAQKAGGMIVERVGNSIALRPSHRRHDQLVCLVGHLDTVPATADNPPRVEGDRLFGLGSADMKAGLAVMWSLLEKPEEHAAYDVAHIFYDAEEGPYESGGLGPLLDATPWIKDEVDLAFCLEPSDNALQLGCLGVLNATVTFSGRAAHSARPWQGENAVHKAAGLLGRLAAFTPKEHLFGDLKYMEVISATLAQGGVARNVVPASFELNLNYRFPPGCCMEQARQNVRDLVAGEAEVVFIDIAPSGTIPVDNEVLERFKRRCAVPVAAKQAWTDVGRMSTLGIDAVNFGPGEGAQAHQPHESTSIALLEEGEALMRRFLSKGEG
ncbi:MAG: succinyl-diaminopimelate desuccinylase [Deltaproteobacteria bacterium]|nr:succinyl-diaminopimelate desuccinylase [Deltaproteobacteria bacterium]